ncbi:hypothetical protein Xaut_3597 [Xanthobacter versatilis]|uniref:Uncharacterized protein n=1 Tax=Xanthobacter autotrophicus (strain ATCC BAA-1158 / Py2) TaxID=78245 RepID=A7ILD2_XANP2|nr:hypothetical protein Xaut_3597 [Xanthobacter autotrophicus Py2]
MNAGPQSVPKRVTIQHILAAVQELYGVEALDEVTGRGIERAGYTLPGSAPVLPRARAPGAPPGESGKVDGREAWECDGCGKLSYRPDVDLERIRARGGLSCCPERKLRAVRVISPAPPPEPAKAEAMDALTDVQWLKKWTTETGEVLKGLWREEFLKTVRFVERHNLSALTEHDGREG